MATTYFVRTAHGEKGPYTREQMKAALETSSFAAGAEYRTGEDEGWRPLGDLEAQFARVKAKKRERRVEEAPDPVVPGAEPGPKTGGATVALAFMLLLVIFIAILWAARSERKAEIGKPCRSPSECKRGAMCMRQVDENRNVEPAGYCTFNCDDDSECKPGMRCEMAMETGSHAGSKWDGSFHKNIKVCVKR